MTGPARWWKPALVGLLVLGAVAAWLWPRPGASQRPTAPPAPVSSTLRPVPVAVAPGVYLLGETEPAAAYAVDTSGGLVLIDSGLEDTAEAVTAQLARLHLDVGRLRAVLLTHVHADHSLGAERLRRRTGARVHAGRADCPPLRKGEPRDAFFSTFHMPKRSTHPTTVDVELEGDETLTFGDTRFAVIPTPGHTPGSVCYLLERPGLRALFTGDVIQHLGPGGGSLGTYSAYLPPRYRGDAADYLATLHRLRALDPPDMVLPGHPLMDRAPQSARLAPEHWRGLLDQGIAEMEELLARYKADGANFLDGSPRELRPGLHYLGDQGRRAVYCLDTPKGLFLFDAPGGPALVAFLAARFKERGWAGRRPTAVLLTSADREATSGLAALVKSTGCRVVAPKAGLEAVRSLCPAGARLLTEEDLAQAGWFDVRPIPLQGRGLAPLAYEIRWAGKTVLVSGRVPIKMTIPEVEGLLREVNEPDRIAQYVRSIDRLAGVSPDLWLPAVPSHGQNANLYNNEWAKVLNQNRQMFRGPGAH